ncbi:MAG: YcgN family cysteine cluster protein [Parahaliea sp.]
MDVWWNSTPLADLNRAQWEALCDGCAKCCLHKLQDEYSGKVFYTRIRCRLLDDTSCRCSDYSHRAQRVPDCVTLTPAMIGDLDWLPATCAYRLRDLGKPLPDWHPLVSGDANSVHRAGVSVRGRTLSEEFVHLDDYENHVIARDS